LQKQQLSWCTLIPRMAGMFLNLHLHVERNRTKKVQKKKAKFASHSLS